MKQLIRVAIVMFMAIALPAATISISDLTDANPIVTLSADLTGLQVTLTFEKAVITGIIGGLQLVPGTRSVILTEPPSDPFGPFQSDFVTLVVGAAAPTFSLTFESDGALNFLADVAALPPTTPTVPENGAFQDVSSLLNSGVLQILVQSDLATSEAPEPGALSMLGAGLLLIGVSFARLRKSPRRSR